MEKIDLDELEAKYPITSDRKERFTLHKKYRSYLEDQVEKDPKNIHALIHLGVMCWEPFHEQEKSIEYLGKAIEYDPENVEARFWLAKCYYHDFCAYQKVRELLLEALNIDPNSPECLNFLASIILDTTEELEDALFYRRRAVENAPDWPMLRFSLAELYLRMGDIASAEQQVVIIYQLAKQSPKKVKNFVEDYYESIVTGKNTNNIILDLESLKEEINYEKQLRKRERD